MLLPFTLNELKTIVKYNTQVRILTTENELNSEYTKDSISLKGLNKILDYNDSTVTCESGIRLEELLWNLSRLGKTLPFVPSYTSAYLSEEIAYSSHHSGFPPLSAFVDEFVLVKPDGSIITVTQKDKIFPQLITTYGQIGVVYSYKIRIIPNMFIYHEKIFQTLPENPQEWLQEGLYRQIYYNPYTNNSLLFRYSDENIFGNDKKSLLNILFNNTNGERFALQLHESLPALTPKFIDIVYKNLQGRESGMLSDVIKIPPHRIDIYHFEFAVPVNKADETLKQLTEIIKEWQSKEYYIWFGVIMRYVKRFDSLFSISRLSDVISFDIPLYYEDEAQAFVADVQSKIPAVFNVGKNSTIPLSGHRDWNEFEKVKRQFDPTGKFYA